MAQRRNPGHHPRRLHRHGGTGPTGHQRKPTSLAFTAIQGGSNPAAQTLSIRNTGGGTLNWTASENTGWLTLTAGTGTGNGTVTLQCDHRLLSPGNYTGSVTLSGGTGVTPVTVPVTFTITPTAATTVNLSPSSLNYAATQGAANPANQNISLTNTGETLNWAVSDDATWLTVSPASGTGSRTLTTSVNTAGLTVGTYNGTLTVSAAGMSPKTVPCYADSQCLGDLIRHVDMECQYRK